MRADRADMTCDECGQPFILIGDRIADPNSPTWRRVLVEHGVDKHDGNVPSCTIRIGQETFQWSISND